MNRFEALIKAKFKNARVYKGSRGLEYVVTCPFCGPVKGKDKMYINPNKRVAYCHREGKSWPLRDIIALPPFMIPPPQQQIAKKDTKQVPSPGACASITTLDPKHPAILWLKNRQPVNSWKISDLPDFNVSYCYSGKRFGIFDTTNTLIFYFIKNSKCVGWQSRLLYNPKDLTDEEKRIIGFPQNEDGKWLIPPKCYSSPGLGGENKLFNYDNASKYDFVVITEGPFDAISTGKYSIAVCGKTISEMQQRAIASKWNYAIVLFDPGVEDYNNKATAQLRAYMPAYSAKLTGSNDPGETPRDVIAETLIEACSSDPALVKKIKEAING